MTTRISEVEQLDGEVLPGFEVTVVKVPPDLADGDPIRDRYDDRSIAVPKSGGSIWCDVRTSPGGGLAALATFAADDHVVRCDTIEVMLDQRRKGIATVLYELASCVFEAPVVPSETLSQEAELFWGDRTQILHG